MVRSATFAGRGTATSEQGCPTSNACVNVPLLSLPAATRSSLALLHAPFASLGADNGALAQPPDVTVTSRSFRDGASTLVHLLLLYSPADQAGAH